MRQGEDYSYKDFYFERRVKPRKTQEAQRKALNKSLDKLGEQRDFWSLEEVRLFVDQLIDEEKTDRGYELLFILTKLNGATDEQLKTIGTFTRAFTRPVARSNRKK